MNYSSKFNNLLKNLSTNIQSKSQAKTTAKKEEKQETLFDKDNPTLKTNELNKDDLYGGMISISSQEPKAEVKNSASSKLNNLLKNVKLNSVSNVKSSNDSVGNTAQNKQKEQVTLKQQTPISKSSKMAKLLSSASVISDDTQITETPVIVQTPKVEPKPEDIRKENLEKTIKNIEKYVARIDLSLMNYLNPISEVGAGYYDFTDYEAEYDTQNRVTKLSSKYNTGVTIDISYDENNNATVNCDNDRIFTLNSNGKLTSFSYPKANQTYNYEYDKDGKLIKTVHNQGYGNIVTYSDYKYDDKGNMTYGPGHKFTYDNEGHLLSVKYDNSELIYDTNGNVIRKTGNRHAGLNGVITYEYDEDNNFVKATDEKGNEYDKHGNVIKYTSVENGVTFTREAKIAKNGQKIISHKSVHEDGNLIEFITDANGFDISQTVTLSDGTTIETTFDSKKQYYSNSFNTNKGTAFFDKKINEFAGMFFTSHVIVKSQTVKNSEGNTIYTLEAPSGIKSYGMFFFNTDTNKTSLRNLSFNNGENVLVNDDMSLNVTKTDGAIDIYDFNKKTKEFELRESIPAPTVEPTTPTTPTVPVDLTYDVNKDGVVDYKDFFEARKTGQWDISKIFDAVISNISNDSNINLNYLTNFYNAFDEDTWAKIIWYDGYANKIWDAILNKIDSNSLDFNKDGRLDYNDIITYIQAIDNNTDMSEATPYNDILDSIKGIDLDADGTITQQEKRTILGIDIFDRDTAKKFQNIFIDQSPSDRETLSEWISKLNAEYDKMENHTEEGYFYGQFVLGPIINILEDKLKNL